MSEFIPKASFEVNGNAHMSEIPGGPATEKTPELEEVRIIE